MDIRYEIEFFSNWHCGSGLAAGADVDALVVKDADGLPYIPGRTIKGLMREAAVEWYGESELVSAVFGCSGEKNNEGSEKVGQVYFGNATLTDKEKKAILSADLARFLYHAFASTAIDDDGIAKDHSLRRIETVVPCKIEGDILNVPEEAVDLLENSMKMIKRLGTGRNRGYGRCRISLEEEA